MAWIDNLEPTDVPDDSDEPTVQDFVDILITEATRTEAVAFGAFYGERACPGPPDAHEHLTPDDACRWCGAAL